MRTHSYFSATSDRPLVYETVGRCFDRIADRHGDRDGLIVRHQDIRWSYAEYRRQSTVSPAASSRSASARATASACGRRTVSNGAWRSSPPRKSAPSWFASIRPIASTNWNSR
ncbi:MAG: hypothetical protein WDM81_18295 [Rhizomicrobium sp.]